MLLGGKGRVSFFLGYLTRRLNVPCAQYTSAKWWIYSHSELQLRKLPLLSGGWYILSSTPLPLHTELLPHSIPYQCLPGSLHPGLESHLSFDLARRGSHLEIMFVQKQPQTFNVWLECRCAGSINKDVCLLSDVRNPSLLPLGWILCLNQLNLRR